MEFQTPKDHKNFLAKQLDKNLEGKIKDIAIAYIDPNGGGPFPCHTHKHNHYFIVTSGEISVTQDGKVHNLKVNESILVEGYKEHSVSNPGKQKASVIGISLEK